MTGGPASPRLLLLTPNFDNNSLGRTYCLWLLAQHLGWRCRVAGVRGGRVWAPLAEDGRFLGDCLLPGAGQDEEARARALLPLAHEADVLVAVKPLPTSFGLGLRLARESGRPLLLDVDDPDLEVRTTLLPLHERVARRVLQPRYRHLLRLRELARGVPVLVSNPVLRAAYGGALVPHVRPVPQVPPPVSASTTPVVRFVGSPRGHKGVPQLREAVARLADRGLRLEVTGEAPPDARPWERWLGTTTLAEGAALVASADVVAVPSLAESWSAAQLPAKLVDAMALGRAVVASDVPPIRWALGGTGILGRPGSVDDLTDGLTALLDPVRRADLGAAAHRRAADLFSLPAVAPAFAAQVLDLLAPTGARPPAPLPGAAP